jgi:acetamidase/formamidase
MKRIPLDQANSFAFDAREAPKIRVAPGEAFEIETDDAGRGYFKTPADKAIPSLRPGFDRVPAMVNPIAGPVYVEGAERGDTLVVHIDDILVGPQSWTAVGPKRGPLGESSRWPELSSEYTTMIFRHEPGPSGTTRDGTLHFNERLRWPITPFIGTIGVAPDREVTTSADGQGEWGGNLDIRDVAPGNQVHLPVYHPGALFWIGDVHASQGDTEFTGTAAETRSTVRIRLELIKGRSVPFLRIVTPEHLIAVHVYRPLEVAVETATYHLMDWLIRDYGLTPTEAYCLVSTCPDFRINVYQMCKIGKLAYVAGAEMPRRWVISR